MDDLNKKTENDLMALLREKRAALKNFRFGMSGSKVRNMKEGSAVRKDVARIMTELSTRKRSKATNSSTPLGATK